MDTIKPIQAECLADVVFSRPESRLRLETLIKGNTPFPANGKSGIILSGIYGTGKTMLAKMLPQLFEISRTDNDSPFWDFYTCKAGMNGVSFLDTLAKQAELTSFNESGLHYVVLDEVDNFTENAQAQLKALMNCTHAVYIMTTNHVSKINLGVIDRSYLFEMHAPVDSAWLPLARKVWLTKRKELPTDSVLLDCIKWSNGTARQVIAAVYQRLADIEQ